MKALALVQDTSFTARFTGGWTKFGKGDERELKYVIQKRACLLPSPYYTARKMGLEITTLTQRRQHLIFKNKSTIYLSSIINIDITL